MSKIAWKNAVYPFSGKTWYLSEKYLSSKEFLTGILANTSGANSCGWHDHSYQYFDFGNFKSIISGLGGHSEYDIVNKNVHNLVECQDKCNGFVLLKISDKIQHEFIIL